MTRVASVVKRTETVLAIEPGTTLPHWLGTMPPDGGHHGADRAAGSA